MKTNLTKYLFIIAIFAGALVNPVMIHAWPTTEQIQEANKVAPSWLKQAKLLLAKIKSNPNLLEYISQYQDEFQALNKKYDIEKHIFLVARNEYIYIEEVDIYQEIEKIVFIA